LGIKDFSACHAFSVNDIDALAISHDHIWEILSLIATDMAETYKFIRSWILNALNDCLINSIDDKDVFPLLRAD
jgi:hypothetical protein